MKIQLYIISLLYVLLFSCKETITNPNDKEPKDTTTYFPNCPIYDENKYGQADCDRLFSVSYDGKYAVLAKHWGGKNIANILLSNRYILNIQTGEYILVGGNENGKIGGTGRAMEFDTLQFPYIKRIIPFEQFQFCPYNSSMICFRASCDIDTAGENKNVTRFYNLFTYNLQTKEMKLITPSSYGKWGHAGNGFTVRWLPASKDGNDKFLLGPNDGAYIYSQQVDKLEKVQIGDFTIISNDLRERFIAIQSYPDPDKYYFNDKEVFFYDTVPNTQIRYASTGSISFDNKYVLVMMSVNNPPFDSLHGLSRYLELWLMEVDKLKASTGEFKDIKKINFRFQHCMYTWIDNVMFTPQNTLLVSMHPHNSPQGNVYEMDLKGNILRKITNN